MITLEKYLYRLTLVLFKQTNMNFKPKNDRVEVVYNGLLIRLWVDSDCDRSLTLFIYDGDNEDCYTLYENWMMKSTYSNWLLIGTVIKSIIDLKLNDQYDIKKIKES